MLLKYTMNRMKIRWAKIQLKKNHYNAWPNKPVIDGTRYQINAMELLRWLRRDSDFSIVTFDTLGDVIEKLPLASAT